jgi:hypothetical protein
MLPFSSLPRPSFHRKQRRVPRPNSPWRNLVARVKLSVECLEDRIVPASSGITDPYTLYTSGDAYIGAAGQDQQSFLANYHPFDKTLGASLVSRLTPTGGDPGSPGPFAVTTEEYDLGNLAFRPTDSPWASSGIELTGEIKAPTDLGTTAHPVIVLMHGRHVTTYNPTTGGAALEWPPVAPRISIPSYQGYDYLGDVLASQGYVVISIGTNGINARDNGAGDAGALARAQLMQRTFGILEDLNRDGMINTRPADATHPGTDLFSGPVSPFGTRYVGALDLQNVGIMGHSRGGEGVVRSYNLNQSLGSPYGIKAVFALAPIDATNSRINNVPFAVLLPYNDGDVSTLEGAHFYDDSRYNVPGDTGAKFSIEVMGANHNFYNTVWSPGLFPFIGAPPGFGGTTDDGNPGPPSRLTETQQQGTGLAYMSAFFRTYVGGETQFLPILTGDAPPPPSAQVTPDRIHNAYLPPSSPADRRDINQLTAMANLTTNTLGGAVVTGGLASYAFITGGPSGSSEPHRNLGQATIGYTGTTAAFWENDLPAGSGDERGFNDLQFRIGVNYGDPRNPVNMDQDFSVSLTDGSGASYSVLVSAYSNDLFDPPRPGGNPHEVLNTVRIPLDAFIGQIDLGNVVSVRFDFDQHTSGAFQITDLAFADALVPAPLNVQITSASSDLLIRNNPTIANDVQVVDTATSAVLAEYLLSSITNIVVTGDAGADTLTVSYQYGDPLPAAGLDYVSGTGVDTLNVDDQTATTDQTFTLTGTSVQRSGSAAITFSAGGINFVNVIGGSGNDIYNVTNTEPSAATTLNTGSGANTVNVMATGGALAVNGSAAGSNTLVGADLDTAWFVTGADSGNFSNASSSVSFTGYQNLVGGAGANSFAFNDNGSLSGSLNGGPGANNTLDYSTGWTGNVLVDLQTGAASAVAGLSAGAVSGIQNVLGAGGGGASSFDLLIGNGGNVLTGGLGRRNILVAGASSSTLIGGDGEDLIIAGTTSYDTEATLANWQTIAAYWTGADPFATRVSNLQTGSGVPILDPTAGTGNVFGNGGNNVVTGNGALALIFTDGADTISGFDPLSQQVPITP